MSIFGIGQLTSKPSKGLSQPDSFLKIAIGWILGWWLVETTDFDGARRIRRLYQDAEGRYFCHAIGSWRWCELLDDGTVAHGVYVTRWRPFPYGRPIVAMHRSVTHTEGWLMSTTLKDSLEE